MSVVRQLHVKTPEGVLVFTNPREDLFSDSGMYRVVDEDGRTHLFSPTGWFEVWSTEEEF